MRICAAAWKCIRSSLLPNVNTETYLELRNISDKIATEVVFAKPGEDVGLLPINCMLAQIEEILAKQAAPEPLPQAAQQARRWLDEIFESTGTFSALNIERLGEWVTGRGPGVDRRVRQ